MKCPLFPEPIQSECKTTECPIWNNEFETCMHDDLETLLSIQPELKPAIDMMKNKLASLGDAMSKFNKQLEKAKKTGNIGLTVRALFELISDEAITGIKIEDKDKKIESISNEMHNIIIFLENNTKEDNEAIMSSDIAGKIFTDIFDGILK